MRKFDRTITPSRPKKGKSIDFEVANHGSIFLLAPLTQSAWEWIENNIDDGNAQWFAKALVVERRFIRDTLRAIESDSLSFTLNT